MTRDEYFALLQRRYEQVDLDSKESIHAYNEYVRQLRSQLDEED